MSLTNCRFYEEKYPEIDSFVMVNVKQIAEMGAYVKLLEYDNIDGMILLSELSRRRIRSIQKLIRVGRNEVVVVLRVDKEKGYIDLSKRRVSPEDIVKCEERYNKSKMVHSIMRHVAEKTNVPLEELYTDIGWPLNKKYGHAVDAFKLSITNPSVWEEVTFKSQVIKDELQSYISKRLTPQVSTTWLVLIYQELAADRPSSPPKFVPTSKSPALATKASTLSNPPSASPNRNRPKMRKSKSAWSPRHSTFSRRRRSTRAAAFKSWKKPSKRSTAPSALKVACA